MLCIQWVLVSSLFYACCLVTKPCPTLTTLAGYSVLFVLHAAVIWMGWLYSQIPLSAERSRWVGSSPGTSIISFLSLASYPKRPPKAGAVSEWPGPLPHTHTQLSQTKALLRITRPKACHGFALLATVEYFPLTLHAG